MSWIDYKPFNNGAYNTIWELARQIVDQYRRDYPTDNRGDDELIQEYGIPYLTRWLFTTNGVNNQIDLTRPEWDEFIKQFITKFLNFEICWMNPNVWKKSISRTMIEYQWYIEESAQPLYEALKNASAFTTNTKNENITGSLVGSESQNTTDKTTVSSRDSGTSTSNREGSTQNTTEVNSSQTTTDESASEGSNTNNFQSNNSATDNSRILTSDMPQSNVSAATVGNPELQTWTYASAMQDTNAKHSGNETNTTEQSNTQKTNGTSSGSASSSGTQTGTKKDNEEYVNTYEHTNDTDYTSARKKDKTDTRHSTADKTERIETLSDFALTREKYRFFSKNMKTPIYNILNICYKYFISTYPDESRLGFLEWDAIDNITSKVKEVAQ